MRRLTDFAINLKYAFRFHKPLLTLRLTKTVLRSYVFKRTPLRYVDFCLDFTCNLNCQHCFAQALKRSDCRTISIDEYRDIAEQCMALGVVNFSFQGGEPLLIENLSEIIGVFEPQRNLISVTTNGTLLTEPKIKELKKMGVDILTVSLDSSIASEHDTFRGVNGSFEKTLRGITLALKNGLRVTIGCVVTHASLRSEGFLGLINTAQRLKSVLYIILPVAAGRWANRKDIYLTDSDLLFIDELTRKYKYVRTDFLGNLGGYGCGAAKEILYITPYGDVLTCPFVHISFGNVLNERLSVIRKRALKNGYFAGYHKKCLASTDEDFIRLYLSKTLTANRLPLRWDEVFNEGAI